MGKWGYRSSLIPEPIKLKLCMSDYVAHQFLSRKTMHKLGQWVWEPSHVACRNAPPPPIGVIPHEEVCQLLVKTRPHIHLSHALEKFRVWPDLTSAKLPAVRRAHRALMTSSGLRDGHPPPAFTAVQCINVQSMPWRHAAHHGVHKKLICRRHSATILVMEYHAKSRKVIRNDTG